MRALRFLAAAVVAGAGCTTARDDVPAAADVVAADVRAPQDGPPSVVAPPDEPDVVVGAVEAVSEERGFCVLSIGSYDGVGEDASFRVFRDGAEVATLTIDVAYVRRSAAHVAHPERSPALRVGDVVRGKRRVVVTDSFGALHRDGPPTRDLQIHGDVRAVNGADYVLGVGSKDGVRVGDEFTIARDWHFVAAVVIVRTERDSSVATIKPGMVPLDGRPGDDAFHGRW